MGKKSNNQLRARFNHTLELRKGNRAQPIPQGQYQGTRGSWNDAAVVEGLADYLASRDGQDLPLVLIEDEYTALIGA